MENKNQSIDVLKILRSVPDLYLILSPDYRIVEVSDSYLSATMVNREDILGRHLFDIFPDNPNDPKATGVKNLNASLECVLKNKVPDTMAVQKYDIRRPLSEGGGFEERYWSPINTPVLNQNNEVQYIIHRVEDVTEFIQLKRVQTEQVKIAQELRTRAGQMEMEIYQRAQEVQEMNNKLRIANDDLQAFNYTVSHDLRNPVQAILGFSQIIKDDLSSKDPTILDYLNEIYNAAQNMKTLIEELIQFSQSGQMSLVKTQVNVSKMANDILNNLRNQWPQRKMDYRVREAICVNGDEMLIRIVLDNIIQNAWKYTEKTEQAQIEIGVLKDPHSTSIISIIFIRDNGIGFSPEEADKLFLPFTRSKSAKGFSGFGIGLATVKRIVDRHGGKIWAQGELGKGATVFIQL